MRPRKLDNLLQELRREAKLYYKKGDETYNIKDQVEYIGVFKDTRHDYAFVETETESHFIPGKFVLNAFNNDTVKFILVPSYNDRPPIARIVRVAQRNGSNIVGRIIEVEGVKTFSPDISIDKYKYTLIELDQLKVGQVVVTKFKDYYNKEVTLSLREIIADEANASIDFKVVAAKYNLELEFPQDVIDEAKSLSTNYENRKSLEDRLIVTIDGASSRDLDDAIDIRTLDNGNWILGVHIADVSHYVKPHSKLDDEALKRGVSTYLLNDVIPMLPQILSNDLCSLNPNTRKVTLTADIEIDKAGKIINTELYESVIISKHRLTYDEVDTLLDAKVKSLGHTDLDEMLLSGFELSKVLRAKKFNEGFIDFDLSEVKVDVDETGEPLNIYLKSQTTSEALIEDLMVVANEAVATAFASRDLPSVFRVHDKPKDDSLATLVSVAKTMGYFVKDSIDKIDASTFNHIVEDISGSPFEQILKKLLIQTMSKAEYATQSRGHYALGIQNYLHFTSPIRRYPDLAVHRLVKNFIIDQTTTRATVEAMIPELTSISKISSEAEKNSMGAERKLVDIKKSRFLSKLVGETFEGTISSLTRFGIFVNLPHYTQGLILLDSLTDDEYKFNEVSHIIQGQKNQKQFKMGQKIMVKLVNIDSVKGQVDLELQ